MLVACKLKLQRHVTLSTTKSEYVRLSHVSMEILFIRDILMFLGMEVELPIIVRVDNQGAVYLTKNRTLGQRTKHVDTRYHLVQEYIEDGILRIVYTKSKDNTTDIMMNSTSTVNFKEHLEDFMQYN